MIYGSCPPATYCVDVLFVGAIDASNILKPALARGLVRCLGTTTSDEYRQRIEKDAALARRFQPVFVAEPSLDTTITILR